MLERDDDDDDDLILSLQPLRPWQNQLCPARNKKEQQRVFIAKLIKNEDKLCVSSMRWNVTRGAGIPCLL